MDLSFQQRCPFSRMPRKSPSPSLKRQIATSKLAQSNVFLFIGENDGEKQKQKTKTKTKDNLVQPERKKEEKKKTMKEKEKEKEKSDVDVVFNIMSLQDSSFAIMVESCD
jgi:hypothetical protein